MSWLLFKPFDHVITPKPPWTVAVTCQLSFMFKPSLMNNAGSYGKLWHSLSFVVISSSKWHLVVTLAFAFVLWSSSNNCKRLSLENPSICTLWVFIPWKADVNRPRVGINIYLTEHDFSVGNYIEFLHLFFATYMWEYLSTVFYFCNLKLFENFREFSEAKVHWSLSLAVQGLLKAYLEQLVLVASFKADECCQLVTAVQCYIRILEQFISGLYRFCQKGSSQSSNVVSEGFQYKGKLMPKQRYENTWSR